MAENPYAPPRAPAAPPRPARPVPLAALIGAATDFAGTFAFGIAASTVVAGVIAAGGGNEADIRAALESGGWQAFSVATGAAFTALGGFIAARLARASEYRAALFAGIFALLIGEAMIAMSDGYEVWMRVAGDLIAIPSALFGGWLQRTQRAAAE